MSARSARPLRKEWVHAESGGIMGEIRMEFGQGVTSVKTKWLLTPLGIKPFTLAFPPGTGGLNSGSLPNYFLVLGAHLPLGPPFSTL